MHIESMYQQDSSQAQVDTIHEINSFDQSKVLSEDTRANVMHTSRSGGLSTIMSIPKGETPDYDYCMVQNQTVQSFKSRSGQPTAQKINTHSTSQD